MLSKLKKEKSSKKLFMIKGQKVDLRINSNMNSELIAEIISDKLLKKIKDNVC